MAGKNNYDEQLISSAITSLKSAGELLDSSCLSLSSIVNGDSYYSDLKTGLTNLKELMTVHSEFAKFVSNSKSLYDTIYADMKQSVDNLESSNFDIIYDTLLAEYGMVDQKDERWKNFKYGNGTLGGGGCGPSSVANALIVSFGITDPDKVKALVLECAKLGGAGSSVVEYLTNGKKRSDKYPTLNGIIDNAGGPIYYMGGSGNKVVNYINSNPPKDGQKVYLIGKMSFQSGGRNDSSYANVINIVDTLYKYAPNTNITFFGMAGGTGGRAFGSKSDSGHYVSLLINVKDFKENNTVYLLDSYPRRLPGESNNGEYWGDYNFTAKPNYGDFKKVNAAFKFTHLSRDVVKITVADGGTFDTEHLRLLGLSGGTHLVTSPGTKTTTTRASTSAEPKKEDCDTKFNTALEGKLPQYSGTTDTSEENKRARTEVAASKAARAVATTASTSPVEPVSQPSRITGSADDPVTTEPTDDVVPEEYTFPEETRVTAEAKPEDKPASSGDTKPKEEPPTETPQEEKPTEVETKKKTVTASTKTETTEVTGVMPTITATSSGSPTAPTTTGSTGSPVTVSSGSNPNGYSMPENNPTPSTPSTPTVETPTIETPVTETPTTETTTTNTPSTTRYTASAGMSDVGPRYSDGGNTTPTETGSMTSNAQPTATSDIPYVENDPLMTEDLDEESNSNRNKILGATGATLVAAGTVALLLNSNPSNYKVELIGESETSINLYQNYIDPGCKVLEDDKELEVKPNITMNLDNTTPGTYKMTCSVENDSKTRYINVNQANDNTTVGNVNIYYNDSNVLPSKYDDTEATTTTTYTIKYNDNVDYIKYCVAEYGESCKVSNEEKHNNDTFNIKETGKRVIYIEKYSNGKMVKEVRYINIK